MLEQSENQLDKQKTINKTNTQIQANETVLKIIFSEILINIKKNNFARNITIELNWIIESDNINLEITNPFTHTQNSQVDKTKFSRGLKMIKRLMVYYYQAYDDPKLDDINNIFTTTLKF